MQKGFIVVFSVIALISGVLFYQSQQYDFETIDGQRYQWQSLQGQWVVVNYFAEWCAPCLKEVPELNDFHEQALQSADMVLFAVSYDPLSQQELTTIQQQYDMQFPLLNPEKTSFIPIQTPQYLPATFIIDPNGTVSKPLLGEQTSASLLNAIEQLQKSF